MALDVSRALREPGEMIPFQEDIALVVEREDFKADAVRVAGHITGIGESVAVMGDARVDAVASCARCLKEFPVSLSARLDETFVRSGNLREQPLEEGEDLFFFEGESVDLGEAVEAAIRLNLPMRFLCKEGCEGLCPHCGADRNDGSCRCAQQIKDNPFSALRSLYPDE